MSEWWTYRLSDFLMFSPATYGRLVEGYNREVWPLHLLTIAAGAMLLWWAAARRPGAVRLAAAVLAPVWLWIGWTFHWQRYAPINWAAEYFAMAFALQAMLLFVVAVIAKGADTGSSGPLVRAGGLALAAIGMFVYPFLALVAGRPWSQAEVFGVMPGPTAAGTLGLLLVSGGRQGKWLAVIPALAILVELATRWAFAIT
jgi:hypothetical protein